MHASDIRIKADPSLDDEETRTLVCGLELYQLLSLCLARRWNKFEEAAFAEAEFVMDGKAIGEERCAEFEWKVQGRMLTFRLLPTDDGHCFELTCPELGKLPCLN